MCIFNPCEEASEAPKVCDSLWVLSLLSPGKPAELQRKESTDRHPFQHGDKVKCLLDIDILREMQEGHGGWNPKMAEVHPWIFSLGTIPAFPSSCTAQEDTRTSLCDLKS